MKLSVLAFILPATFSLVAHADDTRLTSELTVSSVVKQHDGSETLAPAKTIGPGDLLEYRTVYTNRAPRPISRLVTNLPIPSGTEWVSTGTRPNTVLASLDGKLFAAVPLMRKLQRADGQWINVPVPLAEYRALRWPEQQLAAGSSFTTTARVRVVSDSTPSLGASEPRR